MKSPDTEKGKWINQIHQTTCIQTGQTELNDKYMVYAEIDLQEKKYERKVISGRLAERHQKWCFLLYRKVRLWLLSKRKIAHIKVGRANR